jgi:molecular chaperone DnaK
MRDKEEIVFEWPCGHSNEEGARKCKTCGFELVECGIDLGTTYSLCGLCSELEPSKQPPFRVELSTHHDRRITPSVVSRDKKSKEFLVGFDAVEKQLQNPEETIYSVKRLMGKRFDDNNVQYLLKRVKYRIVRGEGGMAAIQLGEDVYTPTEISAEILKRLKADAENTFGKKITHAVITVPAYFDDIQRQATKEAGRMAGFFVKRIVSEPVASTYAYGYGLNREKSGTILVFDMGGGTFDITIVFMEWPINTVRVHIGDMWLGGDDVDEKLVEIKRKELEEQYGLNPMSDARFMVELRQKVRRAKEILCSSEIQQEVLLSFDRPLPRQKDDGTTEIVEIENLNLTRKDVGTAVSPLVDKAIKLVREALREAELSARDIDYVIRVGGSSYLPGIQEGLEAIFPPNVIVPMQDPTTAVAIGVAILAKKIRGMYCECGHTNEPIAVKCAKCPAELEPIIDRTHKHYGIEVKGGKFEVVMPKGTVCPTSKQERRTFYTAYEGQRKHDVPIYQGDKERAKDNAWQGILTIQLPEGVPVNTPVDIFMSINKDRLLEVEVECQGMRTSINIKPSDWAWSLREEIEWAKRVSEKIPNVLEFARQGHEILEKWDKTPPDSEEARRLSKEGKKVLAELELIHWHDDLDFFTRLLAQLLEYHALLDPKFVELMQTALETCQAAQANQEGVSRYQVEEQLNRVSEKLSQYEEAETLLFMVLGFRENSVNPSIQKVKDDLETVGRLIKEDKVSAAQGIIRRAKGTSHFQNVESMIIRNIPIPILLKSELGYGRDVDTHAIQIG